MTLPTHVLSYNVPFIPNASPPPALTLLLSLGDLPSSPMTFVMTRASSSTLSVRHLSTDLLSP
ncbi:hypothetical protein SCLCIDRAFT_1207435, partial [Scleroderma citrinum Foug A]